MSNRPWWTWVIPYPGPVPELPRKQWKVLGLLAAAELFDQYDMGIMGLALLQIQQGLGVAEGDIAQLTAVIRLGVLPAFALTVWADRVGRRRLLLATILGFTICTFATAFAQTPAQYASLQFLARIFVYAETMLAVVVVTEELAAGDRGFGIGILAAIGMLGHALASILFAFVEVLPFGWRALYALGAAPLLALAWFRRGLPETRRFEEHRERNAGQRRSFFTPIFSLVTMYPGRVAALTLAFVPFEFVVMVAAQFMAKTLQEARGYEPWAVTTLYLLGGTLGILGNVAAGMLADRFGRRVVMGLGCGLTAGSVFLFYNAADWLVPPAWIALIFSITGMGVLFKALGTELFPTSYRSTASGLRGIVGTLGGVAGLALEGVLYEATGSHAAAITWTLPALLIPPLVILTLVPETAGRELEEIAPER